MSEEKSKEQKWHETASSRERVKKTAFTVVVKLELDIDLANALGNFILDSGKCENTALLALGHLLVGT